MSTGERLLGDSGRSEQIPLFIEMEATFWKKRITDFRHFMDVWLTVLWYSGDKIFRNSSSGLLSSLAGVELLKIDTV